MVPTVMDAVLKRIDLAGLAEGVIAEVDLAEIIRQSTGSVASDTVRGVRMQSISGDEAVGRAVGRLRVRLRPHVALLRAVVCSLFPIGLLLCAGGRELSLRDFVLRTSVIYDWRPGPPLAGDRVRTAEESGLSKD
jgi:hypothetical protein